MKDAQKPDHVSLNTLVGWLKEGRFVIPDFQREFEWDPTDIRDLMRSVFLDYYIGSLLLWRGKTENFDALACEPVYGFNGSGSPTHIVLDGQQRLTALYYAFVAPDVIVPTRSNRYLYFIRVNRFIEEDFDKAFEYDWTQRGPKLLTDRQAQFREHLFPLVIVGNGGWELFEWIQGYETYWREQATAAEQSGNAEAAAEAKRYAEGAGEFGGYIRGITEQYQIAYIELDREIEIDKVCDIFTQINSRGVRLDVFDLINALLKPKDVQLKHMWRKAQSRLAFADSERMNVYVLQVMSLLRQSYCSPKYLYYLLPGQARSVRDPDGSLRKEVLVPTTADFVVRWDQAVDALEKSMARLKHPNEFGVVSSAYLPYVSILPVFAALQASARALPPERQLDARRKFHHWYWASVFTNRYSGSVESTSARDFVDVNAWFADDLAQPGMVAEFSERFRHLDLRSETRSGTSVYNGIFNLLVIGGARDWMTGNVPQHDELDDHHIVPKSWGGNLPTGLVDTILNRTPLTADTNRHVISDRLPNAYLPELIQQSGEMTVRGILESHFISPTAFQILLRDPFTPDDFEAFIGERQKSIREAIESLLIKERLDLAPRLRELDASVEGVELGLRAVIVHTLNGDVGRLPSHVQAKADERIQGQAKKDAAFDLERAQTLPGMLEFCDLRELQDTIVNKLLWPEFAPRFVNKETLATRFTQLADLRNGIRHNRAVDDITKKDGEAALLWFGQVLAK